MAVVRNGVETYQEDRLVVDQRASGLVQEQLRRRGFASHEAGTSDPLGLTLLALPQFASSAALLRQDAALVQAAAAAQQASGLAGAADDMSLLLFALRREFWRKYDGWAPAMDKDQVMVQGMPYIKGAVGLPDRAGPLAIPPASGEGGPRVAILDTDLYAHPGLAGRYLGPAHDFGPEPPDTLGHSVFVAGLIAARAPAAELVVRPVLDADGENASSWDVATQMAAIQAEDVAVLNLSLGCATADRQPPLCLRRAAGLLLPGVVIVASAGNNGSASPLSAAMGLTPVTPIFPAAMDGVIGVGAYQGPAASPEPAPFSPPGVPWVRLLAPGVRVTSTFLSGKVRRMKLDQAGQLVQQDITEFGHPGYATWDGTSFAAAGVSGAIAALMQDRRVSAREALDLILNAQVPGSDIVTA